MILNGKEEGEVQVRTGPGALLSCQPHLLFPSQQTCGYVLFILHMLLVTFLNN